MSETAQRKQRLSKSGDAFRTISEVSQTLEVQQHVLRFWETKFNQIKPVKRGGGRRYYRPEDIDLLRYIHKLLYTEGYTIKGVQKLLKEQTKGELMQSAAANKPVSASASSASVASSGAAQKAASAQKVATIISSPVPAPRDARVARDLRQRSILEAMLGDLVELRDTVRAAREACETK